jgi:hypothetical protein
MISEDGIAESVTFKTIGYLMYSMSPAQWASMK